MELYFREYGSRRSDRPSLVFLHGLFGASINWHSIARHFEGRWHVIVPDLRNHGRSPHDDEMSYGQMAGDVFDLLQALAPDRVIVIGHSMGGKTGIMLAQNYPDSVAGLVVVDIAPVSYDNEFKNIIAAFRSVKVSELKKRSDADEMMGQVIDHQGIRQYLLQNLVREEGRWYWRLNLDAIVHCMEQITGFEAGCNKPFFGPARVIRGELSDYVVPQYEDEIFRCLPGASIETISGVGHWVYAEAPESFIAVLESFLNEQVTG